MRYFTEEYFKLFVHHMNVRRVADKKYSNKEIETLKKRQLNRLIRKAEIAHDIPPTKFDIYKYTQGPDGLKAEDFSYTDPETCETVIPSSLEEVDAMFEEKYRKESKEFGNRPPFNPKRTVERFEEQCAMMCCS